MSEKKQTAMQVHRDALTKVSDSFMRALPITAKQFLTPERITQIVCNAMSRNPTLLKCTPPSLLKAVMDIVQLGLEPGGPLGHAYLVPFKNSKLGVTEATPIIGYKGYIDLAYRSGNFSGPPHAEIVRANDEFEANYGEIPKHRVNFFQNEAERGEVIGAYCVARFTAGGNHAEFMSLEDMEKIRQRSRGKNQDPWKIHTLQMYRKTTIRRAKNYWPTSTQLAMAAGLEESIEAGHERDPSNEYGAEFAELIDNEIPQTVDEVAGQSGSSKVVDMIPDVDRQG